MARGQQARSMPCTIHIAQQMSEEPIFTQSRIVNYYRHLKQFFLFTHNYSIKFLFKEVRKSIRTKNIVAKLQRHNRLCSYCRFYENHDFGCGECLANVLLCGEHTQQAMELCSLDFPQRGRTQVSSFFLLLTKFIDVSP